MTTVRLQMRAIHKRFGPTRALAGVDFELRAGEIHALVGENGAGKSTLMKILSGAEQHDSGSMQIDGQTYSPAHPFDARRMGVAMVYQELTLAPHLSVAQNLLLGMESRRFGFLQSKANHSRVCEALALLHHPEIAGDCIVSELSTAAQQLVEIGRAFLVQSQVLILDEPTSSLTQADALHLFELLRTLKARGVAIVYISHFLEEVALIADRLTVLRDGQSVATGAARDFSRAQIITHMVGRDVAEQFPRVPHAIGEVVFEVKDLHGCDLPCGATLALHRGEILGLAGIVGAGRTELLRAIFGLDSVRQGQIIIRGFTSSAADPKQRISQGLGMLSEDRKTEGLALGQSIVDNLTFSRLSPYTRWGWIARKRRDRAAAECLAQLAVRYRQTDQDVSELSGGNQQKVALARLLHQQADVLLLDEPTRGIDVASKAEIYRIIGQLASQGKAILFVSSYLPELLGICDRLAVMARGRLGAARPIAEWDPERVMQAATEGVLA